MMHFNFPLIIKEISTRHLLLLENGKYTKWRQKYVESEHLEQMNKGAL